MTSQCRPGLYSLCRLCAITVFAPVSLHAQSRRLTRAEVGSTLKKRSYQHYVCNCAAMKWKWTKLCTLRQLVDCTQVRIAARQFNSRRPSCRIYNAIINHKYRYIKRFVARIIWHMAAAVHVYTYPGCLSDHTQTTLHKYAREDEWTRRRSTRMTERYQRCIKLRCRHRHSYIPMYINTMSCLIFCSAQLCAVLRHRHHILQYVNRLLRLISRTGSRVWRQSLIILQSVTVATSVSYDLRRAG